LISDDLPQKMILSPRTSSASCDLFVEWRVWMTPL
jgi:hypothetical protein